MALRERGDPFEHCKLPNISFTVHLIIRHICVLIFVKFMSDKRFRQWYKFSRFLCKKKVQEIFYIQKQSVFSLSPSEVHHLFLNPENIFSLVYQSIHPSRPLLLLLFPLFSHGHTLTEGQRFGTEGRPGLSRLQVPSLGRISWTWGWRDTAFVCVQVQQNSFKADRVIQECPQNDATMTNAT